MKYRTTHSLLSALGACLISLLITPIFAEETAVLPDTSTWVCNRCPNSNDWVGDWVLGLIWVDGATPKFADYRGMLDHDFYLAADGESHYRNEAGYYFDFIGRNLGVSSRSLEMRGGNQGVWEARGSYQEIPRYLGYGTVTPYEGVGTDSLTLPNNWQAQPMEPAGLKSTRKTYDAGFTARFESPWRLRADYERQDRSGTRAFGGGVFAINAAWFPAPLDTTTNILNAAVEFNATRGQLSLEFMGSEFKNDSQSVSWDNPFATGFGDQASRTALEPGNKFQQFNLEGAFRFSPRFRVSGKASIGKGTQNAPFLPYSINPRYEDLELPRASLDGKLETSMYNLSGRVYLVLMDRLDLTASYKASERDNKTPVDDYTPVLMEVWLQEPRSNRPYSYDRSKGRVELRWRPAFKTRVNGGFERETLERTYQEIRRSDEDSYWGEIQFLPWVWLDARLKYERSDRDTSVHEQQGNYDRAENPLMRKFNMADRERDQGTVQIELYPMEQLGISLSYFITDDDYDQSIIGITQARESSVNLEINYALSESAMFYGFISENRIKSEMSGTPSVIVNKWNATTDDEIQTWGLGVNGNISTKWSYGFDYVSSKSDGRIDVDSGSGEAPFPVLTTKLTNARVYLKYIMNDRWGLGLDAYREQYDTSNWFIDGYGPLDINGLLTMGDVSPNYDVYVVRMTVKLTF